MEKPEMPRNANPFGNVQKAESGTGVEDHSLQGIKNAEAAFKREKKDAKWTVVRARVVTLELFKNLL